MYTKIVALLLCISIFQNLYGQQQHAITVEIAGKTIKCYNLEKQSDTVNKIAYKIILQILREEISHLQIDFSEKVKQEIVNSYREKYNFDSKINQYLEAYKTECDLVYNCLMKMHQEKLTPNQAFQKYLKNDSDRITKKRWQLYCDTYPDLNSLEQLGKIVKTPKSKIRQEMITNSIIIPQYLCILNNKVAKINSPSDLEVETYMKKHKLPICIEELPKRSKKEFCKTMLHKAKIGKWWKERFEYYDIKVPAPYSEAINLALERCIHMGWSSKFLNNHLAIKDISDKKNNDTNNKNIPKQNKVKNWMKVDSPKSKKTYGIITSEPVNDKSKVEK